MNFVFMYATSYSYFNYGNGRFFMFLESKPNMPRYTSRIGGKLPVKRVIKKVAKRAAPLIKKAVAAKRARAAASASEFEDLPEPPEEDAIGGALGTGGALRTGGVLPVGGAKIQGFVSNMSYPQMIHTVGHMDAPTYHALQGVASMFLPKIVHPLKRPYMAAFGGAIHAPGVSRVATADILKAPSGAHLSAALHQEWLDQQAGRNVGGGLFDSLKMVIKKGVSAVSKGAKVALGVGKKLRDALSKGTAIAKSFEAPLTAVLPGAGALLRKGITGAEALQEGLGVGLAAGEKISAGLEDVSRAVNPEAAAESEFGELEE